MAKESKQTNEAPKKQRKLNPVITKVAWLVVVVWQAFSAYVLLSNFTNYFVVAAGMISVFTAVGILLYLVFKKS